MPYYRCSTCGVTSYSSAGHSSVAACPECDARLGAGEAVGSQAQIAISRTFEARDDAPAKARRAVFALGLPKDACANLTLIVSELVTNAVRHGVRARDEAASPDEQIHLLATNAHGRVRLVVRDNGPGFSPSEPGETGGLGLVIVNSLSDEWGVDSDDTGCTVWCMVSGQTESSDDPRVRHVDRGLDGGRPSS